MGGIAYQNKDIASKLTAELLVGNYLGPFGLPEKKVVGLLPTNLPAVESNELRLDNLFEMEDGAVAILDYESEFSRENFVKYLNYVARIMRRYANQKSLDQLKKLKILVIYTADVSQAQEVYDLGGVVIQVEASYLIHQNTKEIYGRLKEKVSRGEELNVTERMELMILPLTIKGKKEKQEYIQKAIELAKKMEDRRQGAQVIAGILTFTDKILDPAYAKRVKGEIKMNLVSQMIFQDGFDSGVEQGMNQGITMGITQGSEKKLIQLVCRKLRKKKSPETISEELEEELEVIQKICKAAKGCGPDYNWEQIYKKMSLEK
ncbi:hypothetical protein VSQ48_19560 [Candidatus Ventrimonas sp. KK005]